MNGDHVVILAVVAAACVTAVALVLSGSPWLAVALLLFVITSIKVKT